MAMHSDARLNRVKGKAVAMGLERPATDLTGISERERRAGQFLADLLYHAKSSPKALSVALDHSTQSKVSRWMAGIDLPKLLIEIVNDDALRLGAAKALAAIPGDRLHLKESIEISEAS